MASTPKTLLGALLLTVLGQAWGAGEFYCCQDPAGGRRICGDSLPGQCRTQAYKVFDKGGNLLREVAAPLTPEQKKAAEEEAQHRKKQAEEEKAQRLRDQALLDRYNSPADIDKAQSKAESEFERSIQPVQKKLDETLKRQQKLVNEAEFYQNRPLPAGLAHDLQAIEREVAQHRKMLEARQQELVVLRNRYAEERQRYQVLTDRRSASAPKKP